jgi:dihydropyrimidinase
VREARDRGVPAFAETCPQYLLLSIEELERPNFEGAKYVFTPPLRPKRHLPKLWDGLRHDHLQVVSTDHCPFCFEDQKSLGKDDFTKIPNGGPGIENRLQLIHHHGVNSGKLSLNRFVELTSTTPARIFGMYPKKGEIAPGSDADLVVWDPNARHTISAKTHHMRVDYSMFEGFECRGNARTVLSRGEAIVDGGRFFGKPGRGQYLKRTARGGAWK